MSNVKGIKLPMSDTRSVPSNAEYLRDVTFFQCKLFSDARLFSAVCLIWIRRSLRLFNGGTVDVME